MSCTSVKITRVGEIGVASVLASEGVRAVVARDGAIVVGAQKVGHVSASLDHDAIQARLSMVCTPSIRNPYLEIEPEILWVYTDLEQYNDVLSNTYWRVN